MKKTLLACLAGTYLITGIGYAAPVVDVAKGDTFVEVSQYRLDVDDQNFKLNATEIGLIHGLTNKLALSTGLTFTGDKTFVFNHIPVGPLDAKIYDIKLQYKMTKELAPFIGYKRWEINHSDNDVEFASRNGLQYGLIYNKKLSDRTGAFVEAAFGRDIKEYKLGLTYDLNKDCRAELCYRKIDLDTGKDIDAKGFGLGLTYKF